RKLHIGDPPVGLEFAEDFPVNGVEIGLKRHAVSFCPLARESHESGHACAVKLRQVSGCAKSAAGPAAPRAGKLLENLSSPCKSRDAILRSRPGCRSAR